MQSGLLPEVWKFARVTHIHNKGPTKLPSSYRPIVMLPRLSPTFEIVLPQLRKQYLQYICDEQFEFEPTGTADVGVVITDEVVTALEAREELRVVAYNLKGAFDQVWWNNLFAHLWAAGIKSKPFKLLRSYLSQRSSQWQQVFRVKKLVGRQWGAPNSNYLLVMVSTLVMPFSMDPLSPRMTTGCITQK